MPSFAVSLSEEAAFQPNRVLARRRYIAHREIQPRTSPLVRREINNHPTPKVTTRHKSPASPLPMSSRILSASSPSWLLIRSLSTRRRRARKVTLFKYAWIQGASHDTDIRQPPSAAPKSGCHFCVIFNAVVGIWFLPGMGLPLLMARIINVFVVQKRAVLNQRIYLTQPSDPFSNK